MKIFTRLDFTRHPFIATIIIFSVVAVVMMLSAGSGEFPLSPSKVVAALFGYGDEFDRTIVIDFRLPRIVMALFVGMALAVSGAILQGITKNPLAAGQFVGLKTGV